MMSVLMIFAFFTSCNRNENNCDDEMTETSSTTDSKEQLFIDSNSETTSIDNHTENNTENNTDDTNIDISGSGGSCPPDDRFHFNSYDELKNWVYAEQNDRRDRLDYNPHYVNYMKEVLEGKSKIYIPILDGEPMNTGYGITFFTQEWMYYPWIWYKQKYGMNMTICQCGLTEDDRVKEGMTVSEYLKSVSEEIPTAEDADEFSHMYTKICEKNVTVCGEKVTALIYGNGLHGDTIVFIYDGYLFNIKAFSEFNDDFFERISFMPLTEYENQGTIEQ